MYRLYSAFTLATTILLTPSLEAADLSVTVQSSARDAAPVTQSFQDVKVGKLPAMTIMGEDGKPLRIQVEITAIHQGQVKTTTHVQREHTNFLGMTQFKPIVSNDSAVEMSNNTAMLMQTPTRKMPQANVKVELAMEPGNVTAVVLP